MALNCSTGTYAPPCIAEDIIIVALRYTQSGRTHIMLVIDFLIIEVCKMTPNFCILKLK